MVHDQPIIVYKNDKKKVGKKRADRIADEWEKDRKERGSVLQRLKLSEFLNSGKKPEIAETEK